MSRFVNPSRRRFFAARRASTRRSPARASSPPTAASAMPPRLASRRSYGPAISIPCRTSSHRHGRTCRARCFPAGKDKTDGELAVQAAIDQGCHLAGACRRIRRSARRSRLPAPGAGAQACRGRIADAADQRRARRPAAACRRDATSTLQPGTLFSVLGFSELTGLSVSGARWPLDRITMAFGSSLTISNEVTRDLRIEIGSGRALLLAHPYPSDPDF